MATNRINATLYGIELPDTFYINKLIKQSSKACDSMVEKANELEKQIKNAMRELRKNPIPPADAPQEEQERVRDLRNALIVTKNRKIKERDLNLAKARSMEANADAYGDIYRLISGEDPINYRKTERVAEYKELSQDEIKDVIARVWGDSDQYPAKKAVPSPVKLEKSEPLKEDAVEEVPAPTAEVTEEAKTEEKPAEEKQVEAQPVAAEEKPVEEKPAEVAEAVAAAPAPAAPVEEPQKKAAEPVEDKTAESKAEPEKKVGAGVLVLALALVVGFAYLGTYLF